MSRPDAAPECTRAGRTPLCLCPGCRAYYDGQPAAPAAGFGEDLVDLPTLALEIADEAARGEIEGCCKQVVSGDHTWNDLKSCHLNHWAFVDRAATYLDRRGDAASSRIVHSQAFPHLVRFEVQA